MPVEPPFEPLAEPDAVATKSFSTGFRGFDQSEVRAYLTSLASAMRVVHARQDDLALRLSVAEQRARSTAELEPRQLTALLGEETARVLESARTAAAEIRTKADETAARQRQEADDYALDVRARADDYALDVRTRADADTEHLRTDADGYAAETRSQADTASRTMRDDADAYAADVGTRADANAALLRAETAEEAHQLRSEAETHAAQMRGEAAEVLAARTGEAEAVAAQIRAEVEQVLAQAEDQAAAEIELGRQQGRELVTRAEMQRDEVTAEIGRRRRAARQQLEQVSAARERLIAAYRTVRDLADRATDELDVALPEARAAAEAAGQAAAAPDTEAAATEGRPAHTATTVAKPSDEAADPGAVSTFGRPRSPLPEPRPDHDAQPDPEPHLEPEGAAGDLVAEAPVASDAGTGAEPADRDLEAFTGEAAAGHEPASEKPAGDIDALFARIRAGRADEAGPTAAVQPPPVVFTEPGSGPGTDPGREPLDVTDDQADAAPDAPPDAPPAGDPAGAVETLLERRDGATDEVERSLARRLKRALADEQNTVLDAVRRAKRATFAGVLPEAEQHEHRYADAATDDLVAAASAGRRFYGELVQAHAGASTSPAQTHGNGNGVTIVVDTGVADLAQALAAELVGQVRARVESGFADGEADPSVGDAGDHLDETELTDRIRACYREWKSQRIVDLARHFVLTAFSRGAYDAAPVGACLAWVVDNGGTPCPDADDNALAGALTKGEPFPTGHVYPPAHPGCRCLVVPEAALAEVRAPVPHR